MHKGRARHAQQERIYASMERIGVEETIVDKDFSKNPFALTVEQILTMAPKMTKDEKAALKTWEKINLGGKGTTDWPRWAAVTSRLSH